MAFTSASAGGCSSEYPWRDEVPDPVLGLAGDPIVDPEARLLRLSQKVHRSHPCAVVLRDHRKETIEERVVILRPQRVGDVQPERGGIVVSLATAAGVEVQV